LLPITRLRAQTVITSAIVRQGRIERTSLAANPAGMAKKPEPPRLVTWDVYRAAHKPKIVGSVYAADADEAVQKAAQEFKVDAWPLIAAERR
jgi:hypothetical protein